MLLQHNTTNFLFLPGGGGCTLLALDSGLWSMTLGHGVCQGWGWHREWPISAELACLLSPMAFGKPLCRTFPAMLSHGGWSSWSWAPWSGSHSWGFLFSCAWFWLGCLHPSWFLCPIFYLFWVGKVLGLVDFGDGDFFLGCLPFGLNRLPLTGLLVVPFGLALSGEILFSCTWSLRSLLHSNPRISGDCFGAHLLGLDSPHGVGSCMKLLVISSGL